MRPASVGDWVGRRSTVSPPSVTVQHSASDRDIDQDVDAGASGWHDVALLFVHIIACVADRCAWNIHFVDRCGKYSASMPIVCK